MNCILTGKRNVAEKTWQATQRYQSATISDDEAPPPSEFSLTTQRPSVFNPSSITADFNYDSMIGTDTDEGNDYI